MLETKDAACTGGTCCSACGGGGGECAALSLRQCATPYFAMGFHAKRGPLKQTVLWDPLCF